MAPSINQDIECAEKVRLKIRFAFQAESLSLTVNANRSVRRYYASSSLFYVGKSYDNIPIANRL